MTGDGTHGTPGGDAPADPPGTAYADGVSTASVEYRIEDLAHLSGTTVRTIRAYQDRGLLPRPVRRGRANVYDDSHLARLRQTAGLLERGYTLVSIKDLLDAWDEGRGLGGVLGLVTEVDGPWTDEKPSRLTRGELDSLFGRTEEGDEAIGEAVALGVLERLPGTTEHYRVPSPQELTVAAELHSAGVPLPAISEQLRELRGQVEHIATRLLDFTNEHVFARYLGRHASDEDATQAADLVRRLRPLAQHTVDAELARAMRTLAARSLDDRLRSAADAGEGEDVGEGEGTASGEARGQVPTLGSGSGSVPGPGARIPSGSQPEGEDPVVTRHAAGVPRSSDHDPDFAASGGAGRDQDGPIRETETIRIGAETLDAVRELVGEENTAAFITAAVQRETQARAMDHLASRHALGTAHA